MDIVYKLRNFDDCEQYCNEAADEIERLRKSLLSAKECINDKAYTAAVMVIDTALQQKESE
jgi:hypothetical protein